MFNVCISSIFYMYITCICLYIPKNLLCDHNDYPKHLSNQSVKLMHYVVSCVKLLDNLESTSFDIQSNLH